MSHRERFSVLIFAFISVVVSFDCWCVWTELLDFNSIWHLFTEHYIFSQWPHVKWWWALKALPPMRFQPSLLCAAHPFLAQGQPRYRDPSSETLQWWHGVPGRMCKRSLSVLFPTTQVGPDTFSLPLTSRSSLTEEKVSSKLMCLGGMVL